VKLHKLSFIYLFFLLCWRQPVLAAILVSSGGSQKISVGTPSAEIGFKILDEMGTSQTGLTVTFSLVEPSGKLVTNALSSYQAKTDATGQVFTSLTPRSVVGIYTITATLTQEQFVSTYVTVVAGLPTTLAAGDPQTFAFGKTSDPLKFRLTDAFGNALVGQVINFSVKNSLGEITKEGLTPPQATTDKLGQVSTQFKPPKEGEYVVLAALDEKVINSVTLRVTPQLPKLPSLGLGKTLNPKGQLGRSEAVFYGGLAVNGGKFEQEAIVTLKDEVAVTGVIEAAGREPADLVVVASYKPTPLDEEKYYLLNEGGSYQPWDGQMASLKAFIAKMSLPWVIPIYRGKFLASGELKIYFGYRLTDGTIVFNGNQSIQVLIK